MKNTIITFIFLFQLSLVYSQTMGYQNLNQLEESPAGSKIIRFIQLINSGEEITEQHVQQLFAKTFIERHTAEKLLAIFQDIREVDGQLALYDANRVETFKYEVKAMGLKENNWLDMPFTFEKSPPYKIKGIGVNITGKKAKASDPMLSPDKKRKFKAQPKTYPSFDAISQKADELAKAYQDMNWFEGVILIAKDGKAFYEKAFGWADRENKIPNTIHTKFRIGSINKSYTATLVMQMVEKGQLSYTDLLEKFDLGFPKEIASKITIRHLLTHTAGFGDIFFPKYLDNIRDYKDIDDILPLLLHEPLIYEPGEDQSYSNYGYIVLGAILEKISGKKFGDLLQENILSPIDAKNTHYDIAENIEGEAKSYRFQLDGSKKDHTSQLEYCTPDGGMYSTAADLLKYYQSWLYTEKILSHKAKMAMANGFQHNKGNWGKILNEEGAGSGDAGGGPGVSTLVEMAWKENYTLIVLANTDYQIAEELGLKIMSFIQGKPHPSPQLPVEHFVMQTIKQKGMAHVKDNFADLLDKNGYAANPMVLNNIGYQLMRLKQFKKAIEILQLNIELYPDKANPYDSLGEAYYKMGDYDKAIANYEKALAIDKDFLNSKKMLKELKEKRKK